MIRLLPQLFCNIYIKRNPIHFCTGYRRAKVKVQKAHSDLSPRATCEAESRTVVVPIVVNNVQKQDDPVATLPETRGVEVANAVPHDTRPTEDCFTLEVFPEKGNAFLLDFFEVAQSEASLDFARGREILVDHVTLDPLSTLLVIVEPRIQCRNVVFRRSGIFQFWVHDRFRPLGIRGTDGAIDADDGAELDFGLRFNLHHSGNCANRRSSLIATHFVFC